MWAHFKSLALLFRLFIPATSSATAWVFCYIKVVGEEEDEDEEGLGH